MPSTSSTGSWETSRVLVSGQNLWLNRDVVSGDVTDFEEALQAGEWEAAVACCVGSFLDGFHVSGMAGFERLGRNAEARSFLDMLAAEDSLAYAEHLGILAARDGDRGEAESALSWLAARPDGDPEGLHPWAEARIAAELGDVERALTLLRRALDVNGEYALLHRDHDLRALRTLPEFRI